MMNRTLRNCIKASSLFSMHDPVTNYEVGWWLKGPYEKFKPMAEDDYKYYSKLPKINNWDMLNKFFEKDFDFHGRLVYTLSPELRNDPKVLEKAIEKSLAGWCICLMGEKIQKDPEIVKMVLNDEPGNIDYILPEHLDNPETMKILVEKGSDAISRASDNVRNNKDLAIIGLKNGVCLNSFGMDIKSDENLVKLAMEKDPHAWMYASDDIKDKYRPYKIPNYVLKPLKYLYFNINQLLGRDTLIDKNSYVVPCMVCKGPAVPLFLNSKPTNICCSRCFDNDATIFSQNWYDQDGW